MSTQTLGTIRLLPGGSANVERVAVIRLGENTAEAARQAGLAQDSAEDASASAAVAESLVGPTYASTAAGLAATTSGQSFAVNPGTGVVTIYTNSAGSAVAQRTLATTAYLAASTGAAQIGAVDGAGGSLWTTVQGFINKLLSSAGASVIGFVQAGVGAVARTVQAKLRDTVSVKDFGAVGDGTTDDTAAIQAAANYAALTKCDLYIPFGNYRTSSTLSFGAIKVSGDGYGTQIRPTITNGSAAINFTAPISYWSLTGVTVWADLTAPHQNCTGIQFGGAVGSSSFAARYHIGNVSVHGCKVGATINGFIGEIDIFIQFCETAINGSQVNAAKARIKVENCINAGSFTDCVGSDFHVMFEGTASLVNGFNWEACHGCTWTAPYLESATETVNLAYFMRFGAVSECQGVKINGGTTFGYEVSDCYWIFDRVDGLDVSQHWIVSNAVASRCRHMRTTANTKRINSLGFRYNNASGAFLCDNSLSARPYRNLVANGNFRAGFKGFRSAGVVGSATMAVENTITRGSGTAVRLTAPAGSTSLSGGFFILPDAVRDAYKGKRLWLGIWLFVPNISEYSSFSNKSPAIALNDGVGATLSVGGYLIPGQWNLVFVERDINVAATDLTLFAYPLNYVSGYTATGNEYVVVGEIFVIPAAVDVDPARVAAGFVAEEGFVSGQNIIMPGTAAPTSTRMTWAVGDRVINSAPAVGQPKGWICTVSGSPGTWVSEGNL